MINNNVTLGESVWNGKYRIPYIEKEDENYYFLNYKKAENEG